LARPSLVAGVGPSAQVSIGSIVAGECVLRYDNESGKGDHRHVGDAEMDYAFKDYETLIADFWAEVEMWRRHR